MDFLGGKTFDGVSSNVLTATQLAGLNAAGVSPGKGFLSTTISDNTYFQVGAKYTIGPWKLFGGYENIRFTNPNNPLAVGAFLQGGYIAGFVNNTNFFTDRTLQTAWVGVRYAITPALDITGAYYHEWQNSFINGASIAASTNPTGTCTDARSTACSGTLDAVSFVIDWRFARHVDLYAGVMWSQVNNGLANGFLQTNPAGNGAVIPGPGGVPLSGNKANTFDPGIGLRYQF
jgi:predicted porin